MLIHILNEENSVILSSDLIKSVCRDTTGQLIIKYSNKQSYITFNLNCETTVEYISGAANLVLIKDFCETGSIAISQVTDARIQHRNGYYEVRLNNDTYVSKDLNLEDANNMLIDIFNSPTYELL